MRERLATSRVLVFFLLPKDPSKTYWLSTFKMCSDSRDYTIIIPTKHWTTPRDLALAEKFDWVHYYPRKRVDGMGIIQDE